MTVRVRMAPSPTGFLHIGGVRTFLFNWLFARGRGGECLLRIENTDTSREVAEATEQIKRSLEWVGIGWDGPVTFQLDRMERCQEEARRLVSEGRAYEEDGAVRFRMPDDGVTGWDDAIRGRIDFPNAELEDLVLLRSDGRPTYNFASPAEDWLDGITHVVRGDDHISNTPKHVLLYRALGAEPPAFAHVPLILGPDRKRLSKRHGATSVMEYHRLGYVPEAMVNFLSLLGWSPGDNRELFTREELVGAFTLQGISGGNAVFNPDKLDWFNQQHIVRLPLELLAARVEPLLREAGLWRADLSGSEKPWFLALLDLIRPRVKRLGQFIEEVRPFLSEQPDYDPAAVSRYLAVPRMSETLDALFRRIEGLQPFDKEVAEAAVRQTAEASAMKAAAVIHATRVALVGRPVSPGLFEVMALLGRDQTLARLRAAQNLLPK